MAKSKKTGRPVIGNYKIHLTVGVDIGKALEEIADEKLQSVSSVVRDILKKEFKQNATK